MPSLNIDLDYFDHPKTKRLVAILGKGADVLPIKLWTYCGKYHFTDGRLPGYEQAELEALIGWWGEPGRLIDALVKVGFLDIDGDCYKIHDWIEHEGHIHHYKVKCSAMAIRRWELKKEQEMLDAYENEPYSNATSNATSIAESNARAGQGRAGQGRADKVNTLSSDKPDDVSDKTVKITYQQIVDAYNLLCPSLSKVTSITDKRKRAMAKAIRLKVVNGGGIEWWESFFKRVEASDFLSGRLPRNAEHKDWMPDFEWIIREDKIVSILEGKHDNRKGTNGKPISTAGAGNSGTYKRFLAPSSPEEFESSRAVQQRPVDV